MKKGTVIKFIKFSILIIFVLLFNLSFVYSATLDEMAKTAVYLCKENKKYVNKDGKRFEVWLKDSLTKEEMPLTEKGSGTGFLLGYHGRLYLITAKHVAENMIDDATLTWNDFEGKIQKYTFRALMNHLPNARWFYHQDADIAVHPVGFPKKAGHSNVPTEMLVARGEKIPIGTKVAILGFPMNLGIGDALSPLLKKSEISSHETTMERDGLSPNLRFILLDDALAMGYSGSPVFISPELQVEGLNIKSMQTKLIGIQSQTMSDKTGGKISLVVPIYYLMDILESAEFKMYENSKETK